MANGLKKFSDITHVYDVLANRAFMNQEYEKAKDLFIKVINRLLQQGRHYDNLNVLHTSLKISKIHELQKDYKNSENGYVYCSQYLENKIKIYPENKDVLGLYALTFDTFGRYLMNLGQFKHAISYFRKAYKASVKLNGDIFKMNVILLNELATSCYVQGKSNKAIQYLRKAEEIGQHLPGMENFFMIYINLGHIYLKQGLLKEAEKNCVEGIKNAKT